MARMQAEARVYCSSGTCKLRGGQGGLAEAPAPTAMRPAPREVGHRWRQVLLVAASEARRNKRPGGRASFGALLGGW